MKALSTNEVQVPAQLVDHPKAPFEVSTYAFQEKKLSATNRLLVCYGPGIRGPKGTDVSEHRAITPS